MELALGAACLGNGAAAVDVTERPLTIAASEP
jgi:hypothetical protein